MASATLACSVAVGSSSVGFVTPKCRNQQINQKHQRLCVVDSAALPCQGLAGVPLLGSTSSGSLRWGASSTCISSTGTGAQLLETARPLGSRRRLAGVVAAGNSEKSYIMIKPDGVQRGLVGEIISRFERKGFTLKGLKLFQTPKELAEEHYGELKERDFFPKLVQYIVSGPVVCMVWEGPGVVASARKLIGVTNPLNAEPGTIRGDFGLISGRNVIHGSDSPENGAKEIALWFKEGEVIEWEPTITPWILE